MLACNFYTNFNKLCPLLLQKVAHPFATVIMAKFSTLALQLFLLFAVLQQSSAYYTYYYSFGTYYTYYYSTYYTYYAYYYNSLYYYYITPYYTPWYWWYVIDWFLDSCVV